MRIDKTPPGTRTLLIIILRTVLRHALATKFFVGPAYPTCNRVFNSQNTVNVSTINRMENTD